MNNRENVLHQIKEAKIEGKKIVFTNGCFDVIHAGHVLYLADAKAQGDILVVGLNSDSSVKRLKGESRPIVPATERKIVLENLKSVDYVIVFEEDTPYELISEIKPDVLVKGGDWQIKDIVGHDVVLSYGGTVESLLFINGLSTTNIIEKIKRTYIN
ncbi:MAG: D-glycero-beta-D-manno-heptose 1-phosphate adenylyltransferase [Candidatus Cloacimonetes bacterium]|nr:D-glycero-beta-D-manno-heptose 1-phosphate adenylyltransferase [Candidatus Cloacimonadota bacterium]